MAHRTLPDHSSSVYWGRLVMPFVEADIKPINLQIGLTLAVRVLIMF